MRADHLAKEAKRLKEDGVLLAALERMRQEAFSKLAEADADDKTAVLRLQQKIAVIEEIPDTLESFILEGESREGVNRGFA